jgi:hypothetical protein
MRRSFTHLKYKSPCSRRSASKLSKTPFGGFGVKVGSRPTTCLPSPLGIGSKVYPSVPTTKNRETAKVSSSVRATARQKMLTRVTE